MQSRYTEQRADFRSLVNRNGMRLFLDNRTPSIIGLDIQTTSSTIKSSFALCRPFVIYALKYLMPSFQLVCNTEKKNLQSFLDLSQYISRVFCARWVCVFRDLFAKELRRQGRVFCRKCLSELCCGNSFSV